LWHPKGTNVHADKLCSKWFSPYRVQYALPNNTVFLVSLQHFDPDPVVVNVNKLKPYQVLGNNSPADLYSPLTSKSEIRTTLEQIEDEPSREKSILVALDTVGRLDWST
jgi:hypothetical protein